MSPGEGETMRGLSRETKVSVLFTEIQEGRTEVPALKRLLTSMCSTELEMQGVVEALTKKLREAKFSDEFVQGLSGTLLPRMKKSPAKAPARPPAAGKQQPDEARPAAPGATPQKKKPPVSKRKRPTAGAIPAIQPSPARKGVPVVRAVKVTPGAPPAKKKAPPQEKKKERPPGKQEFIADSDWGFGGAPAAAASGEAEKQEKAGEFEPGTGRPQILIAEDDDRIRMVYRIKMEAAGYDVTEAADGAEAWKLLRAQPFDAVVLDMKMPGHHGLDVLNRMREAGMEMPVVICTAYDQLADEFVVATYPRLKYLTKPIPPEAIIKGIQDLMEK